MCTFVFTYTDGNKVVCEHVKSAAYVAGDTKRISEQSLTDHAFPIGKTLWMFTESGSFCVTHDGLRCIEVTTE